FQRFLAACRHVGVACEVERVVEQPRVADGLDDRVAHRPYFEPACAALGQVVHERVDLSAGAGQVRLQVPVDVELARRMARFLPALSAEMQQRVDARLGDVGVPVEVPARVEVVAGPPALPGAAGRVVQHRIDPGRSHVRVAPQVSLAVEDAQPLDGGHVRMPGDPGAAPEPGGRVHRDAPPPSAWVGTPETSTWLLPATTWKWRSSSAVLAIPGSSTSSR